jgi:adenylylsulfate kinase
MVLWITGVSGAGKTTLSNALAQLLKPHFPQMVVVDGDVVRQFFGNDLDYSEASRRIQIQRLQRLAAWLERQGCIAVVAALYAHPDLLAWNRSHFDEYFEIYIDAPKTLVALRDTKGLYKAAAEGRMKHVVGVDIPWHAPQEPDFVVDASAQERPDMTARRIAAAVPRLAAALKV